MCFDCPRIIKTWLPRLLFLCCGCPVFWLQPFVSIGCPAILKAWLSSHFCGTWLSSHAWLPIHHNLSLAVQPSFEIWLSSHLFVCLHVQPYCGCPAIIIWVPAICFCPAILNTWLSSHLLVSSQNCQPS